MALYPRCSGSSGRRLEPGPFREFVVKIHSRCDLACDYCYMYEMADQSWRDHPRRISIEIPHRTATRLGEHARIHRIPSVTLILHGGEPLLAGREFSAELVHATWSAADLHVARNRFDEALMLPGVVARQLGARSLSPQCRSCDIHRACGAGLYAHRYRQGTGFYNPSVYCSDLIRLIGHIRHTMQAGIDELRGK